jgi:hypothetical protein
MSTTQPYQERYRFPAGFAQMLFICTAFVIGGLFAKLPVPLKVVELVVFGGGGLAVLVLGLRFTRRAALRVDAAGLTFGAVGMRDQSTTQVPWSDIRTVRISRQPEPPRLPVVTVVRRHGQAPITRPVKGWRLDQERFAEALRAVAPGVGLTDER